MNFGTPLKEYLKQIENILDNMKIRIFKDKNYKGIYLNGKTLRLALNTKKPILELDYPEFYDVKITDYCTGQCPYCYQNSMPNIAHYNNIVSKIQSFFGKMSENEKPFQVAIGGGNPNQHPDFIKALKIFYEMGITPNYTTNGMGLTLKILNATKKYCGGVAVSTHEHLKEHWNKAINLLHNNTKLNLHHIISDKTSIDEMKNILNSYDKYIEYIVLLPYITQGRAKPKKINYNYLEKTLDNMNINKIAFGAKFYNFVKKRKQKYDISLYEPEILSKYLDLKDMKIYKSSFES